MNNNVISNLFNGEAKSKWHIGANVITHRRQRSCIQELLRISETQSEVVEKILDCPSGSGRMVDIFLPRQIVCADIYLSRLEEVKKYFLNNEVETELCDIFNLPFETNYFDLVLNCLLIEHIEKYKLCFMLKELQRVTNRWLIITYPSYFSLTNIYRFVINRKKTILSNKEFSNLVSDAGFIIIKSKYVLPLIANTKVILLEKIKSPK